MLMNEDETLDYLLQTKYSFARFGDGENGFLTRSKGVPTQQEFDPLLKMRLREVINNPIEKLLIGVHLREVYKQHIDFSKGVYGSARYNKVVNREGINFREFFDKFRMLWDNEDVVIVNFNPDIQRSYMFQNAKVISFIKIPRRHCFKNYEEILNGCMILKNKTFLLSCGITAAILAYDLTRYGQRALDIGKIAFEYAKCKGENNLAKYLSQETLGRKHLHWQGGKDLIDG